MQKISGIVICALSILFLFAFTSFALELDNNGDGNIDRWVEKEGGVTRKIKSDRNFDNKIDYLSKFNEDGKMEYEEIDYNYDGDMDDFYYYSKGSLIRREIDSNYDGKIDIWVYLRDGIYIKQYKRDTNFDGQIDIDKEFGKEEQPKAGNSE